MRHNVLCIHNNLQISSIILKLFLKLIYQNQKRFSSKDVQRDTEEDILEMLLEF